MDPKLKATMNQLGNISNRHQGNARKVLTVCSAGLLRSPTMANVLHDQLGYNTRAAGSITNFALIPVTEALVCWADEIVFVEHGLIDYMDQDIRNLIHERRNDGDLEIIELDIPDMYEWNNETLRDECYRQYMEEID